MGIALAVVSAASVHQEKYCFASDCAWTGDWNGSRLQLSRESPQPKNCWYHWNSYHTITGNSEGNGLLSPKTSCTFYRWTTYQNVRKEARGVKNLLKNRKSRHKNQMWSDALPEYLKAQTTPTHSPFSCISELPNSCNLAPQRLPQTFCRHHSCSWSCWQILLASFMIPVPSFAGEGG